MYIELGLDVTAQNKHGETPLHAASQRGQVELIGMLIKRGADVSPLAEQQWFDSITSGVSSITLSRDSSRPARAICRICSHIS